MAWLIEAYNGFDSDVYEDYMTCSVEKILEVCELFNMQPLTEAEQLEILSESAANVTSFYKKIGVKNPDRISSKVTKASKEVANTIKKDGINKASAAHVKSILNQLYDNIASELEITLDINKNIDKTTEDKLKLAGALLFGVVTVNTICYSIFVLLFGVTVGSALTAIIVAPLTEEGAKQVAIKGDYVKEYTILFNVYEASSYIVRGTLGGVPFLTMVKKRLLAAGMHVTTTIIQYLTQNEAIQKKLGIENDEKGKDNLRTIGNITGMVIHAVWNSVATFSSKVCSVVVGN